MNIVAFKETKPRGRWFWVFSHDNRGTPAQRAGFEPPSDNLPAQEAGRKRLQNFTAHLGSE
jgi:hypothetical protein